MTAKVISRFRAKCNYDSVNERFYVDSDLPPFLTGTAAAWAANNDVDPEGVEFNLMVQYGDNSEVWEEFNGSYHLDGTDVYFQRQSTEISSLSNGKVTFDPGTSNLDIYGVAGNQHFKLISEIAESIKEVDYSGSNYVVVSGGSSSVCDDITITPRSDNVDLTINGYINFTINANSSITYARTNYEIFYINSSGSEIKFFDIQSGHRSGSSSSQESYSQIYINRRLNNIALNSSGDWQLRFKTNPTGDSSVSTNDITLTTKQITA